MLSKKENNIYGLQSEYRYGGMHVVITIFSSHCGYLNILVTVLKNKKQNKEPDKNNKYSVSLCSKYRIPAKTLVTEKNEVCCLAQQDCIRYKCSQYILLTALWL